MAYHFMLKNDIGKIMLNIDFIVFQEPDGNSASNASRFTSRGSACFRTGLSKTGCRSRISGNMVQG
jgi:hypothetical protein